MKKSLVIICMCICFVCSGFADQFMFAPVMYFSERGGKSDEGSQIHKKLAALMKEYWFNGLVSFSAISDSSIENVQTLQQAVQVCAVKKCDYLIYGYIRETDSYLFAELRVFNPGNQFSASGEGNPVVEKRFFAVAELGRQDELLDTVSRDIYLYFAEKYDITADERPQEYRTFAVRLPFSVGYWTPTSTNWTKLVIGTFQLNAGAELYPELDLAVRNNMKSSMSFRFDLGYRLGIGNPDQYPAYFHEITVALPVFYNLSITERHGVSFGIGPLYSISVLLMQQKYEPYSVHASSRFGFVIAADYRYVILPDLVFSAGINFDIYFAPQSAPVFSPRFGVVYTVHEKKERK